MDKKDKSLYELYWEVDAYQKKLIQQFEEEEKKKEKGTYSNE